MKAFNREYPLFSLCGLNCGLCPMYFGKYCPGCGGGAGNQTCKIAKCSLQHDNIQYCFQCDEYPCVLYEGIDEFDSFITHRNQLKDIEKVKQIGIEKYQVILEEKMELLQELLDNYNDGRKKNFFSVAVNLLEIEDLRVIREQLAAEASSGELTIKEKAAAAVILFKEKAAEQKLVLKLNKKPPKG